MFRVEKPIKPEEKRSGSFEIGIYTVNGQLIDIKKINLPFYTRNYRLETSNYKQGVYIIKMSGATIDQSIQVIKK